MTTFKQFKDSAHFSLNLSHVAGYETDECGYVYLDCYYISELTDTREPQYKVIIGSEESLFATLGEAEEYLWDEFALYQENDLKVVNFSFGDDMTFVGFDNESTWNGFDNVRVTPAMHEKIRHYFLVECGYHPEEVQLDVELDDQRLIDYSNGFATTIDEDDYYVINR